ncbi:MAG TPA: rhomboid family intramembrane serine protease [Bryobacterales bacterium]|jgi:membrane associated rhomboid family serine protease|nr:rhomboid family intramembrane serine protease [Bryobacterales bacterium]
MGTYRSRYPGSSYGIGGYFPRGVKWLLIINTAVFVFAFILGLIDPVMAGSFLGIFGLRAATFLRGAFWQPVTYMFLHDPTGFGHILINMLTLWMFGIDLERDWGTPRFLKYYFVCGIGAGICDIVVSLVLSSAGAPTIGASGAIYGVLLAFGLLYPNRTVFFSFLFPIPAKYFVMIMGAIAFLSSFNRASPVSNVAHLGGMLFGYLYLRFGLHRVQWDAGRITDIYHRWRRRRLQQKFKVYMRKREQEQDRDRWVH